jgi:uncharacterized protein HemX
LNEQTPNQRQSGERQRTRNLQHQAEHTRTRRTPVVTYLLVLFAVAFLLLLFAYFQQQRANNQATTDALQQSVSAVQSIQLLMEDNDELRQQVEDLENQVSQLESANQTQADTLSRLEKETQAMQWFWQIDDYYVHGSYRKARELIQSFEGLGLKDYLSAENTTGTERYSPAARYQEIYNALY